MSNPESLTGAAYYDPLVEEDGNPDDLAGEEVADPRDQMEDSE